MVLTRVRLGSRECERSGRDDLSPALYRGSLPWLLFDVIGRTASFVCLSRDTMSEELT
jgi:hypothetical protein